MEPDEFPPTDTSIDYLREQDRLLPCTNIARIMARVLPAYAKISQDSKHLMQEAVTEFICFVTSEVNDLCLEEQRRVMAGADFAEALNKLGAMPPPARALPPAPKVFYACSLC